LSIYFQNGLSLIFAITSKPKKFDIASLPLIYHESIFVSKDARARYSVAKYNIKNVFQDPFSYPKTIACQICPLSFEDNLRKYRTINA
jgi:hypothetical protein